MTKYEKAVAFMNRVSEYEFAELGGLNDNIVYIITDLGEMRLHEEEITAMAANYDFDNN
jgi:hypothetical protein